MNYHCFAIRRPSYNLICFLIFGISLIICLRAETLFSDSIEARLHRLIRDSSQEDITIGISVISVDKNTPLFDYHEDNLFSVASNMKLLTTAAALDYLGPEFKYITQIEAVGTISGSGILRGDIVIRGSGDPNLSGRFYNDNITAVPESWANAIIQKGIYKITGDIVADDTIFDRDYTPPDWPQNQLSEWYCAQICGLSFNDNCIDVTFIPLKKPGRQVKLKIEPDTSYVTIFNNCFYTANKKEHAYSFYRKPETNQIHINGKYWVNAPVKKEWITIHNPALYLATVFKETLEKKGVVVQGKARLIDSHYSSNTEQVEKITQTVSTMKQTIFVTNKRSQNFYAEQILKTLGAYIYGTGNTKSGIDVLHQFMHKLGYQQDEYHIADGSGLSRGNRLSPRMITDILLYMNKHPHWKVFRDSLPISGIDGSLRRRMSSPKYKNKIRAKTGYISKVASLSGYINTSPHDSLAFSILMNNLDNLAAMRGLQDKICRTLVDYYNN